MLSPFEWWCRNFILPDICKPCLFVFLRNLFYLTRISDLRVDHDLTQRKVADYLNMNLEVYRRYEKGLREIPVWALVKLAELYHTSTDYLLGRTDNPSPPRA